jgi:hypothetical protein
MEGSSGPGMPKMNVPLTTGERITVVGAALFFLSTFVFNWYTISSPLAPGVSVSVEGRTGMTWIAILLAIVAVIEILARKFGNLKLSPKPGSLHLGFGAVGFLITLLRLFVRPSAPAGIDVGLAFGIFISLILAAVWAYGSYMMYSQPPAAASMPSNPTGDGGFGSS